MARLRSNPDFDIFHDGGGAPSPSRSSDTNTDTDTDTATAALRSLPTNHVQNFHRVLEPSPESPAADLEKVHIQTPKKADPESILKNKPVGGCQQSRTPIRSHTFVSPQKNSERKHAHFDLPTTPTATTPAAEQITKVDLPGGLSHRPPSAPVYLPCVGRGSVQGCQPAAHKAVENPN